MQGVHGVGVNCMVFFNNMTQPAQGFCKSVDVGSFNLMYFFSGGAVTSPKA